MNYTKKFKDYRLIFSLISGHNFYLYRTDEEGKKVLKERKIILEHVRKKVLFYAELLPRKLADKFELNHWETLIRKPVNLDYYLWPVDIVGFDEEEYALLFPCRKLADFETLKPILYNLSTEINNYVGLDRKENMLLVENLLEAWASYDNSKYLYYEFSYNNMYFNKDNRKVMFDFSFSTQNMQDLPCEVQYEEGNIIPDYMDIYYYCRNDNILDLVSNYFSMSAILFKLLVGVLPYHGRILEGVLNSNDNEHAKWITIYHENPIFIFDETNDSNRLSPTVAPETYINRWNKLSNKAKDMFRQVFNEENVLRTNKNTIYYYTPVQWQEALSGH